MNKEAKHKIQIAEAAAERFIINRYFTFESLAAKVNMKPAEIMDFFPSRFSMLDYYYESRLILYNQQTSNIPGYPDFTLQEKLSNLFLGLLDQFREHRDFVLTTYKSRAIKNAGKTNFENLLKRELKFIFENDPKISGTCSVFLNSVLYQSLLWQFHGLIYFWMNDESLHQENSLALTDKWTAFIEELYYSKITDSGVDLGKFLFYHSPFQQIFHKQTDS
jgi:hypothetical protein